MRSSLLRTAVQGLLGSNPAVGIGAAMVGVTGLTVGGVIGVTSVTRPACAQPAVTTTARPPVGVPSISAPSDSDPSNSAASNSAASSSDPSCEPGPASDDASRDGAIGADDAADTTTGSADPSSEPTPPPQGTSGTDVTGERAAATDDLSPTADDDVVAGPSSGTVATDGPAASVSAVVPVTTTTAPQPFRISGTITGLTPGGSRRLRLRLDNPNTEAIRILEVRVSVGDLPGCPGSALQIEDYRASTPGTARVIVPARSTATLEVQAAMRSTGASQDACRNRVFPLSFTGTAEQWSGR